MEELFLWSYSFARYFLKSGVSFVMVGGAEDYFFWGGHIFCR